MSISSSDRVHLRVSHGKAYLWDVDDVAKVRNAHHICGILVGTLPHLSQQNVFLGLPLLLAPEEVVLLMEKEAAVLVDDPEAHLRPSPAQLAEYTTQQEQDATRQRAEAELRAADEAGAEGRATSEAALRKRREREERRAAKIASQAAADSADGISCLPEHSVSLASAPPQVRPGTPASTATAYASTYTVHIAAASTALAWYDSNGARSNAVYETLDAARSAGIWVYPETAAQRARCAVFRDLCEQGYFLGGGIKFGGDWLVYPGDPLRYHSHFVAQTLREDEKLRPMEIVAHGRLGTATKKSHLLCAVTDATDGSDQRPVVEYWSVEWAGFG